MDLEEFKLKCPIIMDATDAYDNYKTALIMQGKFFQNHTFIFKLLSSREERILRLRCGMVTNRVVAREKVGKEFNISGERVRQIESNAFRKLKAPKSVKLLMNYTDKTFDAQLYKEFEDVFKSLLIDDIVRGLDSDSLMVIADVDIRNLPLEMRSRKGALKRLYKGGIKTCGQLIKYMQTHSDFKEFGLGPIFEQSVTVALCGLVKDGNIQISFQEIREDYLEHITIEDEINSKISTPWIDKPFNKTKHIKIEELNFSNRTFNCLKRVKPPINTVGDLVEYYKEHGSFKEYIKNFGEQCENEVIAKLDELASLETPYNGMLKDSFCRPKEF